MGQKTICVHNVYKKYRIYNDKSNTLKEKLLHWNFKYRIEEVLQGINFEIKKGEAVALIGKNGCGKSTILKMLSHILKPD